MGWFILVALYILFILRILAKIKGSPPDMDQETHARAMTGNGEIAGIPSATHGKTNRSARRGKQAQPSLLTRRWFRWPIRLAWLVPAILLLIQNSTGYDVAAQFLRLTGLTAGEAAWIMIYAFGGDFALGALRMIDAWIDAVLSAPASTPRNNDTGRKDTESIFDEDDDYRLMYWGVDCGAADDWSFCDDDQGFEWDPSENDWV